MNKEKLLTEIENNLDTFHLHIKKMQTTDFKLHPIDIDLLKKKILELYDKLNELEFVLSENWAGKTINLPEKMPKAEIPETTEIKTEAVHPQSPPTEKTSTAQSTFDLFSGNAEKTIGDKLGTSDEPSIADRIQKSQVNDLRQAIGINEKFLFINELFNGDMGRYNKAIDELNDLKTQQGINTYLLELKVANQWSEDNEAFVKLNNLLDRKLT